MTFKKGFGYWVALTCMCLCGLWSGKPVEATPTRIVSLSPAVTEIVVALGMADDLVGVSNACDYPKEVVSLRPKTGPFGRPDTKAIHALNPTWVIGIGVSVTPEIQQLENSTTRLLLLPSPDTLTGMLSAITVIGNATGKSREAQRLAETLNLEIQRLKKTKPKRKRSVLAVIWTPPLIAAAGNTLIGDVILAAGGVSALEAGAVPFPKINRETLVYRNPEVVLILDPTLSDKILGDSAVTFTKANLDGHVIKNIDPVLLVRPGPRVLEGIKQLQTALQKF